jgi:hypothetical protein
MNKNRLLIAGAAVALIVGSSGAIAQQERGGRVGPTGAIHENGGPAARSGGAAQHEEGAGINRSEPAEQRSERTGPAQNGRLGQNQQNHGRSETTGQAPRNERRGFADERTKGSERNQLGGRENERRLSDERGKSRVPERDRIGGRENERGRFTEERGSRRVQERDRLTSGRDRDIPDRAFGDRGNVRERTTTGQGAAPIRGAVNLSPEQRTRLHGVFVGERNAPRLNDVDFDLAVGRPVPRSVHFVPMPQAIFAIEPAWRGYDYFMVGDQVVIVDPVTLEIVAILDA